MIKVADKYKIIKGVASVTKQIIELTTEDGNHEEIGYCRGILLGLMVSLGLENEFCKAKNLMGEIEFVQKVLGEAMTEFSQEKQ